MMVILIITTKRVVAIETLENITIITTNTNDKIGEIIQRTETIEKSLDTAVLIQENKEEVLTIKRRSHTRIKTSIVSLGI